MSIKSKNKKKEIIVAVSGGFDPIHNGHVRLLEEAKKLGDKLVVILNNDAWFKIKGRRLFMPEVERKEILKALKPVDRVILTRHKDLGKVFDRTTPEYSVCRELEELKPDIFANGGDRFRDDVPEVEACKKIGCKMVFNVGGGKIESSSWLLEKFLENNGKKQGEMRPWGKFENLRHTEKWHLKIFDMKAGHRTSLQSHKKRSEIWIVVEGKIKAAIGGNEKEYGPGEAVFVGKGEKHRVGSKKGARFIEVSIGNFDEKDEIRYEDDYGRANK